MPSQKTTCPVQIIDIRRSVINDDLRKDILDGLQDDPKTLPTLLLYDEKGLNLFEDITYLDEYYPTNAEIEVLNNHAAEIAKHIPDDTRVIELGSGNLRKVDILLRAFENNKKNIEYCALDLSLEELERTFSASTSNDYNYVRCFGLHGTYDDALIWLTRAENHDKPTCIMTLGSSVGNFDRSAAADFLRGFSRVMIPNDFMLVGLDACQDEQKVYHAYNDSKGVTHEFYRNGLRHANECLGHEAFKLDDWAIQGVYDKTEDVHNACIKAKYDVKVEGIAIRGGEQLQFEHAFKYSKKQAEKLWQEAGLVEQARFGNKADNYHIHLLSSKDVSYPTNPTKYAAGAVPTLNDWIDLWRAWDAVTLGMVPQESLLSKPIKLRNALVFYLGHIPTFLDIHMTRASGSKLTEPHSYPSIFERGIDPDVNNPELCHAHSDIPDEYPPISEILQYQKAVRSRVQSLIESGDAITNRRLGRALWLGFEHEVMHLETFLYMLLQSEKTLPPPNVPRPDFKSLALEAGEARGTNEWFTVPETSVGIGMADRSESKSGHFGWDNEMPSYSVRVPSFSSQGRPISNGDYLSYLRSSKETKIPSSWITHSGKTELQDESQDISVRTVFGPIPLCHALDWPVFASYDELAGYATWAGGRIPTLEEARSIYKHAEFLKKKDAHNSLAQNIPAVNGHLSNDGVEETPPSGPSLTDSAANGGKSESGDGGLFLDLEDCNIGFRNWHPVAVTHKGNRLCGQSDMGGVWEWTSSPLKPHEGFKAMDLYPGYTADFFDGKHNIVLGGSWATHPRIAGRTTFVNWYQRNYPFAWAGARLVRDL